MSPITQMYGNALQWESFAERFLAGSNNLVDSTKMTSEVKYPKNGYYLALQKAATAGINREPLTIEAFRSWRELILEESGIIDEEELNPDMQLAKIHSLIQEIDKKLSIAKAQPTDINIVSLLGDITYRIESEQLFHPVSRQMAHLLMSYLTTYFKRPLIIFKPEDKESYLSSIGNKLRMRLLLAEKVREVVIIRGSLLTRIGSHFASDKYQSVETDSKGSLIIQWHDLVRASNQWKQALAEKSEIEE